MNKRIKVRAYMESIFDSVYLILVIGFGFFYLTQLNAHPTLILYGSMCLILGIGDSFHLIPRILANLSKNPSIYTPYLGIGKLVTSISMTIFYVLLFYIYQDMYSVLELPSFVEPLILFLAFLRIGLCLMPHNKWMKNKDDTNWSIYRNIPFCLLGIIIIALFAYSSFQFKDGFNAMPIAITFSFLFYLPVAFYAQKKPKLGMLMIPKTLMYVWIVWMGVSLL